MFGLSDDVICSLRSVFRMYSNIDKVYIFGSRAKGNYREGSDIDLAVCADNLTFEQRMDILSKIDDLMLLYKVDIINYYSKVGTPIYEHINRVGKLFYKS